MKPSILYWLTALLFALTTVSCQQIVQPKAPQSAKTPEEILTGNGWQVEELRYLKNNTQDYYRRGSTESTVDYDNDYNVFRNDNTGTLYSDRVNPLPFTWSFVNPERTKLQFTIQFPGSSPFVVTWENIIYSESSIRYTEYYTQDGVRTLTAGIRTPRR